jgi:hypothetical protein
LKTSQNVSGELASGHCEAINVMATTLALTRQDAKAGQSDFLRRLRTFCAEILFVQFLRKALEPYFNQKVGFRTRIIRRDVHFRHAKRNTLDAA